jgi:regulator of replication initiation timing
MSDLELTMMRRVGELNKELANLKTEADRFKAENARLKAEVDGLMIFCNCTLIPSKELQAQIERLTKAGDAMAERLIYQGYPQTVPAWQDAKEVKPN